jgi:signal recognition particle subunit SRP54
VISELKNKSLSTIVLAGLQGSGKTTTSAKIAGFLKREYKKKPLLVGLDLQRPAAADQLEILAKQNDLDYFINKKSKNCLSVLKAAKKYAAEIKANVMILDTAGRLHIDNELLDELKSIIDTSNPDEILYISDGMTGQDAVNSSKIFMENCNMTGCILTKMDGDSGGGVALSIKEVTGISIKYITFGEGILSIEKFNPERISRRILGLDDVIGLVEQAQKTFDQDQIKNIQEKIIQNEFDLNDFKDQINQMNKMGNFSDIMKFMPKMKKSINFDRKKIVWVKAVIDSMTVYERKNPEIINGSRRKRIASGSGTTLQEVNQLLKQFQQMKKMMKKVNQVGFKKFPFNFR